MDNSDDSGHSYRGGRGDVGDDNSNVDDEDGDDNDNNVVVYVRDLKIFFLISHFVSDRSDFDVSSQSS